MLRGVQGRLIPLLAVTAALGIAPAVAQAAHAKPFRYVIVRTSKGCHASINAKTGKVKFKAEQGHYGKFSVVVRHGRRRITYHYRVTAPTSPSGPPVVRIITIVTVTVGGSGGSGGSPGGGSGGSPSSTPPPSVITYPVLSGTAQQGQNLTLTYGTYKNSTSQTGTYMDCNAAGQNCTPIPGQSGSGFGNSYMLRASDVAHTIVVVETATGRGGSLTVYSNVTPVISATPASPPAPPSMITPPVLSGSAIVGQTLHLTYGTYANATSQTGTYIECGYATDGCIPIPGQTGSGFGDSYVVQPSDVGDQIEVEETATGPGGSITEYSNATDFVTTAARSEATPWPVIAAPTPPPASDLDVTPGQNPTTSCEADLGALDILGSPNPNYIPFGDDICAFTVGITAPVSAPTTAARTAEMSEMCDDFVTVLNYESNIAPTMLESIQGRGEYYFDSQTDDCFALTDGSFDTDTQWLFQFNESNLPYPPSTITAFINSLSLRDYPYLFPYSTEP